MRILLTGGAGYIGSNTLGDMLGADHEAFVVDNFATVTQRRRAGAGLTGAR